MKLHLPHFLAAAVMAAYVSAPAFAETTSEVTYENRTELVYWFYKDGAIVLGDDVRLNIQNITNGEKGYPSDVRFMGSDSQDKSAIHAGDVVMNNNGGIAFTGNNNPNGGGAAIYANNNVTLSDNNDHIEFEDNTGSGTGGAIYAGNGVWISTTEGDIVFKRNKGSQDGGAIYAYSGGVSLSGNRGSILFESNKLAGGGSDGAAIRAYNGVEIINNRNVSFTDHTAGAYGGTIYSYTNAITISGNKAVSFSYSTAGYRGGAIYVATESTQGNGNVNMQGNTSVSFSKNVCGDKATSGSAGGAIFARGNILLTENKSDGSPDVLSGLYFSDNWANVGDDAIHRYADGGALYAETGYVSMRDNGDIVFDSNHAVDGHGGAVYSSQRVEMEKNDSITFTGNTAANGGAIYAASANISILENTGDVTFKENVGSQNGSAIMAAAGNVSISGNKGNVLFDSNTNAEADSVGGAIYAATGVTINNNTGNVTFNNHRNSSLSGGSIYTVSGDVSLSGNGDVSFSKSTASNEGGAIYSTSTVSLTNNGAIKFDNNTASTGRGGAIRGVKGVTITGNTGNIDFISNTAGTEGGAIYSESTVSLTGNGAIKFDNNTATTGRGGAIRGVKGVTITGNTGNIDFTGNTAGTNGGAISNNAIFKDEGEVGYTHTNISGNTGNISFIGNEAAGNGGAIGLEDYGLLEMIGNNGSITFSDNTAGGTGGAIYGRTTIHGCVTIANNTGNVTFTNNRAGANAGAIYVESMRGYTSLAIRNNGNVLFAKNAVVDSDGNYLLRSIQCKELISSPAPDGDVRFSAAAGKFIEFSDSIAGDVALHLNETYNGVAQTGDIIFTGAHTEELLNELLQADGVNRQATDAEINASRQSTIEGTVTVHGGRLRVEDGAVLSSSGIQMQESAGATLLVKNATVQSTRLSDDYLYAGDGNINITSGNTLQVEGASKMDDRAVLMFTLPEAQVVEGSLNATVGAVLDTDTLTLHSGSSLVLDQSHIDLDGGCLTLNMLGEDKINLVLTLDGMLMEDSIVNLFSDIGTLKLGADLQYTSTDTYEFNANEYFTGSMIGEDTMLQFQNGSLTVTGLVTPMVPEPTTATLSLLALAGLAARRRRK